MSNSTEKPASRSSARAPVSAKDKQATDKPASKGKAEEPAAKPKPSKRAVTTKDGQPTYLDMIKEASRFCLPTVYRHVALAKASAAHIQAFFASLKAIVQSGETKEGLSRQGIKKSVPCLLHRLRSLCCPFPASCCSCETCQRQ